MLFLYITLLHFLQRKGDAPGPTRMPSTIPHMELHCAFGVGGEPRGDAQVQILYVLGRKVELEGGNMGFLAHNPGDVVAHHTECMVMHEEPL